MEGLKTEEEGGGERERERWRGLSRELVGLIDIDLAINIRSSIMVI